MKKWSLVGVLPSLPNEESFDFGNVAFVHPSDERLKGICADSEAAKSLLLNFEHQFGGSCSPSALIISDNCPKRLQSYDALMDLRNAFAIASVLHGWQYAIGSANIWFPQYTDYFDLYPYCPSRDGKGLICNGFALNSYDDADRFKGQPNPDLSRNRIAFKVGVNRQLLDLLVDEWKLKYSKAKPDWKQTAIFRSVAVAYRAARLPKGCDHLLLDIGIQLSLWVSAHECLTHPGPGGKTGLTEVTTLLGRKHWRNRKLRSKTRQIQRRGRRKGQTTDPMTYVQHLYRRMYDARNDFLHGNPVGLKTAFLGPFTRDSLSIQVAPLVYSAALEVALLDPAPQSRRDLEEIIDSAFRYCPLESGLLKTKDPRRQD